MLNVLIHHPYLLLALFGLGIASLGSILLFEILDARLRQLAWAFGTGRRHRAYRTSYWGVAFLLAIATLFALWNAYEETGKRFAERKVPSMIKDLNKGLEVARLEGERIREPLDGPNLIQYNTSMDTILDAVLGFTCFKDFATGRSFLVPLGYTPEDAKRALSSGDVIYSSKFSKDHYVLAAMAEDVSWIDAGAIEKRGLTLMYLGMIAVGVFGTLAGSFVLTLPVYYLSRWRIKARRLKSPA